MNKWKLGAIIGAVWGLFGSIARLEGVWVWYPDIGSIWMLWTFGLPALLAFAITDISSQTYIMFLLLSPIIGALIGGGIGYLIDMSLKSMRG